MRLSDGESMNDVFMELAVIVGVVVMCVWVAWGDDG